MILGLDNVENDVVDAGRTIVIGGAPEEYTAGLKAVIAAQEEAAGTP